MVLAIDIGNSDIVLGGYENDTLRFTSRCGTDRRKTADEYALLFKGILELYNVSPRQIKGGIVASVVPSLRIIVQQAMERLTHATFLTLAAGRKTGLNIRLDWPTELGNDLVADAVAAVDRYPKPVIIMDLGTATAVLVVDKKGAYLGGMLHRSAHLSGGSVRLGRSAALHYAERAGTAHRSEHRGVYAGRRSVRLCGHAGRAHRPAGGRAGGTSHGSHHRRVRPPHRPLLPAAGGGG